MPTEIVGYTGSLTAQVRFTSADLTKATAEVMRSELNRASPSERCTGNRVALNLRLADSAAIAPSPGGKAAAGAAYFGAAAGPDQRTPFLLHVSSNGTKVSHRMAELFLDCKAKKPYEIVRFNDFATFPIKPNGTFEFREDWDTTGDRLGLDPKYRLDITTLTRGAFDNRRVAGIVRFDAELIEIASGKLIDTCTSGDQTFEARA